MLTLAPFIYWVFSGIKSKSLLIESCHLYAYIINPMCKKKKNVQLFGVWRGRNIFYFLFQFLCIDFHNGSKAGTAGLGVGGQFLECKFRTFKKGAHSF